MRIGSVEIDGAPRLVAWRDGMLVDLAAADPSLPTDVQSLVEMQGPWDRVAEAAATAPELSCKALLWHPPIPRPRKVICVGLNYADHARETGATPPEEPIIFSKFPTAIAAHDATIVLPDASREVDYEAELVVVIGRQGRQIAQAEAMSHVAGYCCGNDVSARDWQKGKPGRQWLLGKSFDGFAPHGPWFVPRDDIADPGQLAIACRINGETLQSSNTRELIFSIPTLVAYVSGVCTLEPGDLLFTGTPPGVGMARTPPRFIAPGDVVEVEIEGLGILRNRFVAETS